MVPAPFMRPTELLDRVKAYEPDADEGLINKAYDYAMSARGKQLRASGYKKPILGGGTSSVIHPGDTASFTMSGYLPLPSNGC